MHAIAAVRLVALGQHSSTPPVLPDLTLTLAVVIVFSIIVLGVSASLVHVWSSLVRLHTPSWLGFTLFVAIITLLVTVPV